jgi:hydrogenase maturation factor
MTGCGCVTCADEAVPMRIMRIDRGRELALCEDGCGRRLTVELALIEGASPGESVLVHAGVAIARAAPAARAALPGRLAEGARCVT